MDDVSALLEVASAPDAAAETAEVTSPEPTETAADTPDGTEVPATETDSGEAALSTGAEDDEKPVDGRTNPAAIRSALKAFRDLDPKNAPLARELNNAYGRYTAYRDVFPKVAEAQAAKAVLDAVGGHEGIVGLQETIKSVNETDALMHSGDGKVFDWVIDDLKAANKLDSFGKLASPFLDKLRSVDEKAYFNTMKPHFFQGLVDVNLPGVLGAMEKALSGETPDTAIAAALVKNMKEWFDGLRNTVETSDKTKLDPERQAWQQEKQQYETQKQKDFQVNVATTCERSNNEALGGELRSYMKLPFFKAFSKESLTDLASGLKGRLHAELQADKQYQAQMDAFWSAKVPDRAKIESFHSAKVKSMARNIVKNMLNTRYPNFGKGSAAAGAAAAKKVAPVAQAQPQAGGGPKPTFVASKPSGDQIDWSKDEDRLLFISGRAYLTNGKFVAWHPKYK